MNWENILKLDWMEEAKDLLLEFDSDMLDYMERMMNQQNKEYKDVISSIDSFLEEVNTRSDSDSEIRFLQEHFQRFKQSVTAQYNENMEAAENFAEVIQLHMNMVKNVNLTPEEQKMNILGALVSSKDTLGIIPNFGDDMGQPTLDIEKVDALIRMGMHGGEQ